MKKSFYILTVIIGVCLNMCVGYAVPSQGSESALIGRIDVVDYVIFAGIGIFLIGMLFVLLSMFINGKKMVSDEEEMYVIETQEEYIDSDNATDIDVTEFADDLDGTESEEQEMDTENIDEQTIDEPIDEIDEEQEPETEDPEPDPEPEPDEYKIRITLTGTNNSDVKIAEFAHEATVGRRGTNDILISDNAVSGSHCVFTYEDGAVFITDLNSTNGTLLNGEFVEKVEVKSGDLIILGKHQYKINITM